MCHVASPAVQSRNSLISHPQVRGTTFSHNSAQGGGGAVAVYASRPVFTGCLFLSNTAVTMGGALRIAGSGGVELDACTFTRNTASGQVT